MYKWAGENRHYFGQHILQKGNRAVFGIKNVLLNAPMVANVERVGSRTRIGIAQLWVSRYCRLGMAWHFDFGHNRDVACGGIGHQFACFVLGIKPAVWHIVKRFIGGIFMPNAGAFTPCAHFGQFRVFLDFEPPALVFG